MEFVLLYSMQDYFLAIYYGDDSGGGVDVHDRHIFIKKGQFDTAEVFDRVNPKKLKSSTDKFVSEEIGPHKILFRFSLVGIFSFHLKKYMVIRDSRTILSEFRLKSRISLIQDLTSNIGSLRSFVNGYTKYTYHDAYSLWVYNDETKMFTYVVGSVRPARDYVSYDEATSLNVVLEDNFRIENRSPKESDIVSFKKDGMESVTRISLCLGPHKQKGLLAFYSGIEGFKIQDEVVSEIKSLVEMKYLESLQGAQRGLESLTTALIGCGISDLEKYLHVLTERICVEFEYEAASAFVLDGKTEELKLVSTFNLQDKGKPSIAISYQKGVVSHTNTVREEPDYIHVVYDIQAGEKNSHIFDEPTDSAPTNWIGVPVKYDNALMIVIRAKNKYRVDSCGDKVIISPRPTDYFNIRALLTLVEGQVFNFMKYKELSQKLDVHDNFARVYRHEIRGPVSSMVTTPHQLVERIKKDPLTEKEKLSIIQELYDLESLANNLAFIARSYNIEALTSGDKKWEKISLLSELIIPIEKITRRYFKTKYDSELVFDHDSMRGASIYGEKELYNMAIYALLDNAGKYQFLESGEIRVFAKYREVDNYLYLYIENYGLEIKDNEKEVIFTNYGRGEVAKSCKIDGSGIGLWLCRKIVGKYSGSIELDSRFNPVRFKLTIPMRQL